jgi:cytosine/adenosine deaminase-related metal-dependent hydrolase
MNAYTRFLSSLLAEFRPMAQSHLGSLWIDWMDLEGATDDEARFATTQRALRRIRAFGRAANAINAHHARACSQVLKQRLIAIARARAAADPESFDALRQATNKLAEALSSIDLETLTFGHAGQPTERVLVPSCAD